MKLKSFLLLLATFFIVSSKTMFGMYTTFGAPTILIPSARYATNDLKTVGAALSYYSAKNSYDSSGQEVGLLAYQGT